MQRLTLVTAIVAVGLAASTASAQFVAHGISPSVTSFPAQNTGMRQSPGIAPSVTSITPVTNGFVRQRAGGNFGVAPVFQHHHHHHTQVFVPIFPGYGFYPYSYYDETPAYTQPQPAPQDVNEQEPPAPTIFEHRPGYRAPQPDSASQSAPASSGQPASSGGGSSNYGEQISATTPEPTTILVFQDGHQVEIGNYAIVGDTLYNLSAPYVAHKILLAQLDLDATVKANEDSGYEFHLPNQ
jgi:hypothetical protein